MSDSSACVVRGEVNQLLGPHEIDEYAVGRVGELFGAHSWWIAVVETEPESGAVARVRNGLYRLYPFADAPNVYNILLRQPDFREGETVRLRCEELDDLWHIHPENPIRMSDGEQR